MNKRFHDAALADPAGQLEGTGKRMRDVKLQPRGEVEEEGGERFDRRRV